MKIIKYVSIMLMTIFVVACSKKHTTSNNNNNNTTDPTKGLTLIQTMKNATHNIELFSANGKLEVGYNKIFLRVKSLDGTILNNPTATWLPLMHMQNMNHACPYSTLNLVANTATLLEGYIVFQMATNNPDYWELTINYTIDGVNYTATDTVNVENPLKRKLAAFKGNDSIRYVVALLEPQTPKFGTNEIVAMIFKTQNMMDFAIVDGYTLKIDPRMPDMGNHSSPNNVNLTQNNNDKNYYGNINLTMSGYWVVNLQLFDNLNNLLKGEEIILPSVTKSSIYFEIEF